MVSFLKRSKSFLLDKQAASAQPTAVPPMPTGKPEFARQKGEGQLALPVVEMPDLRFSKLDLDLHVQAVGEEWQADNASGARVSNRRSRLNLFGPRSTAASHEDLCHARKASNGSGNVGMAKASAGSSLSTGTMPIRSASSVDVANAANSINKNTKAHRTSKLGFNTMPRSHTAHLAPASTDYNSRQPLPAQSSSRPTAAIPDKKQMKKEEKERMQREKERAKQAIKEQKEAAKREKVLPRSISTPGNLHGASGKPSNGGIRMNAPSVPTPGSTMTTTANKGQSRHPPSEGLPPKPEMRRALQSSTNVRSASDQATGLRTSSSIPLNAKVGATVQSAPKPVPNGSRKDGNPAGKQQAMRQVSSQEQHHPAAKHVKGNSDSGRRTASSSSDRTSSQTQMDASRFPNPHPMTSQSSRRTTTPSREATAAVKNSPRKSDHSIAHTSPVANFDPAQSTPKRTDTASTAAGGKQLVTASSSEGETPSSSTVEGRRRSMDTNTSFEENSSFGGDEHFADARSVVPSAQRSRPARDEEREERTQSRLSMNLDMEMNFGSNATALAAPYVAPATAAQSLPRQQAHERNTSNASNHSTFSAMLLASRPGGAADRAVDQKAKDEQQRQAAYRAGLEQSLLARSGLVKSPAATATSAPQIHSQSSIAPQNVPASMMNSASTLIKRVRENMPALPIHKRAVQPELKAEGDGWSCMGVGDVDTVDLHWRTVIERIKVAHTKEAEPTDEDGSKTADDESLVDGQMGSEKEKTEKQASEPEIEYVDEEVETHYNDLFELLFTATTPDVITRLISHIDIGDIKALRQTSSAVRLTISANRELILNHFLSCIGYRTWTYVKGSASAYRSRMAGQTPSNANKDPCPLSLSDLEAFLVGQELVPEYAIVGHEFARNPLSMDPGMANLARAATRAHNRVLTRLRLQPVYKVPSSSAKKTLPSSSNGKLNASPSSVNRQSQQPNAAMSRHNSYYDIRKSSLPHDFGSLGPLPPMPSLNSSLITPLNTSTAPSPVSPSSPSTMATAPSSPVLPPGSRVSQSAEKVQKKPEPEQTAKIASPWKPGRAAHYMVWVPAKDLSGWLSDQELAECEQELYKAGIWSHIKRGDIVWDTAVGDQMNEGKYVFDGHYLRDLSYAFDVVGHLPSWLNVVMFSPSYWHNIVRSSTPQPVVYLDIMPWKDQILASLRLVQDHVDTFSGHGARYRIAKWLYRSAANVTSGQIVSRMNGGLEIVDEGWHGRIVIETDGTAESAKLLVNRCAGPDASPQEKAALLSSVMGDAGAANKMLNTHDTNGMNTIAHPTQYGKFSTTAKSGSSLIRRSEPQNAPWAIMRERCRPGLIWVRPLGEREKIG